MYLFTTVARVLRKVPDSIGNSVTICGKEGREGGGEGRRRREKGGRKAGRAEEREGRNKKWKEGRKLLGLSSEV